MTAKKGDKHPNMLNNEYWKLRSKDGREKLFKTPEILQAEIDKYFEWADNTPMFKTEQSKIPRKAYKNEDGEMIYPSQLVEIPIVRPYSIEDLCTFLGITMETLLNYGTAPAYKEYFRVVSYVKQKIRGQQISGAQVGTYNANLTARLNGIREHTDNKTEMKVRNTKVKFASQSNKDKPTKQ